jgi:Tol biopolymer transport system component
MTHARIRLIAVSLIAVTLPLALSAVDVPIVPPDAAIAFASRRDGNWEIYVTDPAGAHQRRLTVRDVEDRFPLWSPDRRELAFASLVAGTWELWVMNADGTNQKRLASKIVAKSARAWSADGRTIVFAAGPAGQRDIHAVDVASARVARLTSVGGESRDPCWSPDGRRVAFSTTIDGRAQIFVMQADGTGVRRLTDARPAAEAPRWSPDGHSIAFVSDRDLYRIGADGQRLERLTVDGHVTRDAPSWSPDGSRLLFQIGRGDDYDIGLLRLGDARHRVIARSPAYDGSYTWSGDGRSIAFVSGRDGPGRLYVTGVDASDTPLPLTDTASLTPAWATRR